MRPAPDEPVAGGWHDDRIHSLHLRAPDPDRGDWRSELMLDIDHIVEWLCGADGRMRFRVAPASLLFHDVTDLRIGIAFGAGGARETLNELSIAAIDRHPAAATAGPGQQPYYDWRIALNLPVGGEITFGASGYSLTLRAAPVLTDQQRLPTGHRPPPAGYGTDG